jgi:DNA-binding NtrC family response regulator
VSGEQRTDLALRKVLSDAGMGVRVAQSCAEVRQMLRDFGTPDVMFCDTSLPDGTWSDILALASRGTWPIPVIVLSRVGDINLCIKALEEGAADFIVPPFYGSDISHLFKGMWRKCVAIQRPADV